MYNAGKPNAHPISKHTTPSQPLHPTELEFPPGEPEPQVHQVFYRSLVEHACDAIMVVQQGRVVYRNHTHEKWFGFLTGDAVKLGLLARATSEDYERVSAYEQALCQGEDVPERCEMTLLSQAGRRLYLDVISQAVMHQGAPAIAIVLRDVTAHRETEDALRASETQYRDLYDEAPHAYLSVGTDGRILRANRRAVGLFGYPLDALIGRPVLTLCADSAVGRVRAQQIFQRFRAGRGTRDSEVEMRREDGAQIWASVSVHPIRNAQGDTVASRSIVVDITARKQAEATINALQCENRDLRDDINTTHNFEEIVGTSTALTCTLRQVEQVARTDATVLITGETGTGKELIVRALHQLSARQDRPLIKVNCTALAAGLIESELFGHEKGAFTGAIARKPGRFELANGGILLLDEIGDMPLELQAKLLRVLQEGEFERVGGTQTLTSDVRVVAATNRDLKQAVAANAFRADLFYRLHVFPIHLPPLRERSDDIPLLVQHFIDKCARQLGQRIKAVDPATMERLMAYPWPGNIRELEHVVERALILTRDSTLVIDETLLSMTHIPHVGIPTPTLHETRPTSITLKDVERDYIVHILDKTGWVVEGPKGAACILDLHPNTLRGRMRRLGIVRPHSRA